MVLVEVICCFAVIVEIDKIILYPVLSEAIKRNIFISLVISKGEDL